MNSVAARVLEVLRAHPESWVFELAEAADLPVTSVAIALRQLEHEGFARRGQDERAITIWTAAEGHRSATCSDEGRG